MRVDPRHSAKLVLSLTIVYLVWGSTFLATKIAVTHLPLAPALALRFISAGTLLGLIARFWRKDALPRRLADWRHAAITGFFMVFINNGLNAWALQTIPTNQSALLSSTAAFWIAGLGVFGPRGHPLTRTVMIGLCIGFAGTALMLIPKGPLHADSLLAQLGVLAACLAFSLGTLYFRGIETELSSLMFMAMQIACGGAMLLILALARGDLEQWQFNAPGVIALAYLTLASSCLAFTAYGWLIRNTTPAVIGTYSYVNPAVAAFLGWRFMQESLTGLQLVGMAIIIVGVSIVALPGGALTDPKTSAEPAAQ